MNKILQIGLTCICMSVLFACTSEQKITQKAIMRVITNKQALDTVGRLYTDLHPCANDTTFSTHTDTFTTVKIDTLYPKLDTTININGISGTATILPGKRLGKPIVVERRNTTIKKRDSGFIVNKQREKLYLEEIAGLLRDKASLQQLAQDNQQSLKSANKERTKWIWLFAVACIVVGILGGTSLYFGFKSRAKAITNVLPH